MSNRPTTLNEKRRFKVPHVYVILLGITLVCAILTYIIPAGTYEYITMDDGRSVVDPESFRYLEHNTPVSLMQFLSSVGRGMGEAAAIIFLIFIAGGAIAVLDRTGAITAGIGRLALLLKGREKFLIPVMIIVTALGASVVGLSEEYVVFVPIMISFCMAMGFDSIVGVAVLFCGASIGYAAAFMNPYTVGVAQGIAELPIYSGITLRLIMWGVFVIITVIYVMRYAMKIKKSPELSLVHDIDKTRSDNLDVENLLPFTGRRKACMLIFGAMVVLLIYGVIKYGWYFEEIGALFMGMAILSAIIGKLSLDDFANAFAEGTASIVTAALVLGFARAILVVLTDGQIIHTILHGAASVLDVLPSAVTAVGMYIFQCLLNFIVPSGSGQAAVSMPIMAPLADLTGVTRQTAVLAFQLGDGLSNILTPTSGFFMAGLGIAKIPWTKWVKWFLPLILLQYVIGAVFVIVAQNIGYGPY